MISRYEVVLNDIPISEIDERLLVLDVNYPEHRYSMQTSNPAGSEATIIDQRKKGQASVSVTFELHIYDIAERQQALQNVISWCKDGGVLQINDRPEQRLNVICETPPNLGSVRNWTDPLTVVFSAYQNPYWEDIEPTVITLQGINTRGTIFCPGNAKEANVDIEIRAVRQITTLVVSVGDNTIRMNGLSCPVNGVISLGYDENGILYIRQGTTSLLSKRTPESSDGIKAVCGETNAISVIASNTVSARFSTRGCWL